MDAMNPFFPPPPDSLESRLARLEQKFARERMARLEAEAIAEKGLRDLYASRQQLALLQRITEAAGLAGDLRAVFHFAIEQICVQLNWDFGIAHFTDECGGWPEGSEVWFALDNDVIEPFLDVATTRARSAIERLSAGHADSAAQGETHGVHAVDIHVGHMLPRSSTPGSIFEVPVRVGATLVAIIQFVSRKSIMCNAEMVGVMVQIANQLARAVEQKQSQTLLHDARHDPLTGLSNRVKLAEESSAAFVDLPPDRHGLAMLVADLDGFKAINDRLGHHAGDTLLAEVARRLCTATDEWQRDMADNGAHCRCVVSRTGGDEFAILLVGLKDTAIAEMVAARLHACLTLPIDVGGGELVRIDASIGIACSTFEHDDVDQLQRDADLAMYEAKSAGRGCTVAFTPELGLSARQRLMREQELREAVLKHRFVPYYQPILALRETREVRGFEALARWVHPERGVIEPAGFIETAEQTGLIVVIGGIILRDACRTLAGLQRESSVADAPFISVNIAPQQFLQRDFIEHLGLVLTETGADPVGLRLEVTENVAIIDQARTGQILQQIRSLGIHTSLDDFGTGYSSLSYLHTLPFDSIKIDRSFIFALDNPKCLKIVQTILDLAQRLEMEVTAEGIEHQEHCDRLQQLGCQLGQGYLFGRPLPEELAFAQETVRLAG
jgi:diguanylate cyclase (GGDEF)-like protein